jgi:hypothetical protein
MSKACSSRLWRAERVIGDKGYSSRKVRRFLQRRGIQAVIPRKRNE